MMKITIWETNGKKHVIRLPNWVAINGKTLQFVAKKNGTTAPHCDIVDDEDRQCEFSIAQTDDETIDITLRPTDNKTSVETDDDVQVARTQLPKVPKEVVRNIRQVIKQMRKIHKDWVFVDVQDADGEHVVIEL